MNTKDDEIARKKLGDDLREAREKLGLTQVQVAAKTKIINANYYSIIERGEGNLTFQKLYRIMKVLGLKSLDIR